MCVVGNNNEKIVKVACGMNEKNYFWVGKL